MSNNWIWVIVAAVLIIGGFMIFSNQQATAPALQETGQQVQETLTGETKTFDVAGHAENNKPAFTVKEMKVKEGDRVKINFTNQGTFPHDFTLADFDVKTKQLQQNESETVEFVANKKGTFEYFCGVGNHREQGMVGKLMVE